MTGPIVSNGGQSTIATLLKPGTYTFYRSMTAIRRPACSER
jgi:hypothetical protein